MHKGKTFMECFFYTLKEQMSPEEEIQFEDRSVFLTPPFEMENRLRRNFNTKEKVQLLYSWKNGELIQLRQVFQCFGQGRRRCSGSSNRNCCIHDDSGRSGTLSIKDIDRAYEALKQAVTELVNVPRSMCFWQPVKSIAVIN